MASRTITRLSTRWSLLPCCEEPKPPHHLPPYNYSRARACDVALRAGLPLFLWVPNDLAIMIEGRDGQYYLQAGAVLLAGPSLPFPACRPLSPEISQARGASKTKPASHSMRSTCPDTYLIVCNFQSRHCPYPSPTRTHQIAHAADAWQMKKNFNPLSRASFGVFP